jgi:hypothetical protein
MPVWKALAVRATEDMLRIKVGLVSQGAAHVCHVVMVSILLWRQSFQQVQRAASYKKEKNPQLIARKRCL